MKICTGLVGSMVRFGLRILIYMELGCCSCFFCYLEIKSGRREGEERREGGEEELTSLPKKSVAHPSLFFIIHSTSHTTETSGMCQDHATSSGSPTGHDGRINVKREGLKVVQDLMVSSPEDWPKEWESMDLPPAHILSHCAFTIF